MSYDVSKVLTEEDDEACSYSVKLAGLLKTLAEKIEKNLLDLGKRWNWIWIGITYIIFLL